jgi:transposase
MFDHFMNNAHTFSNRILPAVANFFHTQYCTQLLWDGHPSHVDENIRAEVGELNINSIKFAERGENAKGGYPPYSNDFNPVETVIAELKDRVWAKNPVTLEDLYHKVLLSWDELPSSSFAAIFRECRRHYVSAWTLVV